jgi:hypothetical protein
MSDTLILVGCGQTKQSKPCAVKDMYTSTLFKAARAYAETFGDYWYVLSARWPVEKCLECGWLNPETVIDPYERSLKGMAQEDVDQWRVWCQANFAGFCLEHPEYVQRPMPPAKFSTIVNLDVIVLAGKDYVKPLQTTGFARIMQTPLEGLQIGERIQWLQQGVEAAACV